MSQFLRNEPPLTHLLMTFPANCVSETRSMGSMNDPSFQGYTLSIQVIPPLHVQKTCPPELIRTILKQVILGFSSQT